MKLFHIFFPIVLNFSYCIVAVVKDNGKHCDCFRTTGPSAGYFTNHIFQDFRDLSSHPVPEILATTNDATEAPVTSKFFQSSSWTKTWYIQHWNNSDSRDETSATLLMVNSPSNVYIEKSPTKPDQSWLTLRTSRMADFQSTAEIDTVPSNMLFLSVRYMARISGSPGACAGFFTYLPPGSDPTSVQEADIEVLTGAPTNRVQFTNQPSFDDQGRDLPESSVNSTIPVTNDYTQWNVWRMDWMPGQTSWYVNDVSVANITFQTPKDPAGLIMNMWSDGGLWTGNMSVGQSAYMNVQWIEIAFNTSGNSHNDPDKRDLDSVMSFNRLPKRDLTQCAAVCSIDENVTKVGTPKLLYGVASPSKSVSSLAYYLPLSIILAALIGLL